MQVEATPNKGAVAALHVTAAELELIRAALCIINPDDPDAEALAADMVATIEREAA